MENSKTIKTEFYLDEGLLTFSVCCLLIMIPIGYNSLINAENFEDIALGWFLILLGGGLGAAAGYRLFQYGAEKPVLIISEEGIMDHRAMKGVIPWSIITGYHSRQKSDRFNKIRYIELELNDEKRVRSMFKTVRKYTSLGTAAGTIGISGLKGTIEEVEAAIEAMRPPQN